MQAVSFFSSCLTSGRCHATLDVEHKDWIVGTPARICSRRREAFEAKGLPCSN
jgi:hypothetical protein